MRFQSTIRDARYASYPMTPYPATGYGTATSWLANLVGLDESRGFYTDAGGYAWYYNEDSNKSIDMVFAPGGGTRITFYVGEPKYQGIFNKVVKGKSPVNRDEAKAAAEKAGGKETSGRSTGSSTSAGAGQAAQINVPTAPPAPGEPPAPSGEKLWEQPWFLPVVGVAVVSLVAAIAFWPAPKQ